MRRHYHKAVRYGLTVFYTASSLPYDTIHDLMTRAGEMYLDDADDAIVEGPDYKGRLYTREEFQILGKSGGILFYADIDTPDGKNNIEFLLSEQALSRQFSFSKN